MKRRVRMVGAMLAAALLLSMVGCGSSQPNSETKSSTEGLQETKVDGRVVIYTSMYEDVIEMLDKVLEQKFPDCDIEFFYGGTGTLQSKVAAEMEGGQLGCDILMVAEPSYALELKEAGILHAYKTPEAENLSFSYDADGYWYPVRVLAMVLAYNPELYGLSDVATSFEDFVKKPELKNYISVSNPLTSGTAMASIVALQDKYGTEYFDGLAAQNVAIESGSVALTKLETGECKEVMILEESVLKKREEEGSTLACIYPEDGVIGIPSTIMTVSDEKSANKNTAACEAITDWFLSEEGQSYIMKGWMHSVRKDCKDAPYDSMSNDELFSNTIEVDWVRCYKERDVIRTEFEERVTTAKK